jgi:phenylalanyl-tRNA synthetase beta chain
MRVSVRWLEELVELPKGTAPLELAAHIAQTLTAAGLEVEAIEDREAPLAGIVVARVSEVAPHPQAALAPGLLVCTVEAGGAPLAVVCGAPNVVEGALVCLAPVGTVLPGGKRIESATIRGVVSQGMLCSAQELGLGFNTDGILLLDPQNEHVMPGAPVARALSCDDVVLTLGVTPNRPDALCHLGVARELAAAMRTRSRAQVPSCAERGGPVDDLVQVTVEDSEGCPRYACRVIEGVVVAPSPLWLAARLAACGVRSINSVVDVTNLVMMERGIPLHAFDLDKLGPAVKTKNRATVIVRSARAGERLLTLDGKERALLDTDLVIADPDRVVALAGVMGGAGTEVTAITARILLECASFAPGRVRKTVQRLALHSEASHRFERGCDPNGVIASLDRAASMIAELSFGSPRGSAERPGTGSHNMNNGRVARGVVDSYPKKINPAVVSLRPKRAAQILGLNPKLVDEATGSKLLLSLGLEVEGRDAEAIRFRIPTFRADLTREIDLVGEILRLVGADTVVPTLPARASEGEGLYDARRLRVLNTARTALEAAGFDEAINLAFVAPKSLDPFDGGDVTGRLTVKNPLGEEMSVLRKSLLPGLIANIGTNHRRGVLDVRLYETGVVFLGRNPGGKAPSKDKAGAVGADAWAREVVRLSGIAAGSAGAAFDRKAEHVDFFDVKGALEELLDALGVPSGLNGGVSFAAADGRYPFLHPRARADVWVRARPGGTEPPAPATATAPPQRTWIGVVGEIHPDLLKQQEIKGRVVGFELDLEALARVAAERPKAKPLPRFPSVRRDFALLVDDKLPAADLCARLADNVAVRGLLESIDVFDVYQGEHVPAGKKSLALAIGLRAPDRTLTDEEVVKVTSVLLDDARAQFAAEIRA